MAKKASSRKGLPRSGTTARYRAENDLQALKTAEEIRTDSKRFSLAKKVGAVEVSNIKKVLTKGKNGGKKS